MRGQAEAVGVVVIAMLILAGLLLYSLAARSASVQLQEATEMAVLNAIRRAEELYFYANATGIYARSTTGSTAVYVAAYNENEVIYENNTRVFVALNWTLLVANGTIASMVRGGGAHLVAVTDRGNVFTWDPAGELAQLGELTSRPLAAVLPVGFKVFVGSSASLSALASGPAVRPYTAFFGNPNVEVFTTSTGIPYCVYSWLTYEGGSESFRRCDTTGTAVSYAVLGDRISVSSIGGYIQVYRVVRVSGAGVVSMSVSMSFNATTSTSFVPVVYVYDTNYDLVSPVTRYTPLGLYSGGATVVTYAGHFRPEPWMLRAILESPGNATSWSRAYYVNLSLSDLALRDAYILVGIEALTGTITATISVSVARE